MMVRWETMRIRGRDLRPFLLGSAHTARDLLARCPLDGAEFVDAFDDASQSFYRLINAGNARAFGSLGMPAWVQLDCCTLPTAMIGFAVERAAVEDAIFRDLAARVGATFGAAAAAALDGWRGLVPVSEYTALPSVEAGTFVGFSLYSLLPGAGLGVPTKALALACLGAARQIGMTQYGNAAVRTHVAFGPLELLEPRAPPHSSPDDTFVYRVALDGARLAALARGEAPALPTPDGALEIPVDGDTAAKVAALRASRPRLAVVAPGLRTVDGRKRLVVASL